MDTLVAIAYSAAAFLGVVTALKAIEPPSGDQRLRRGFWYFAAGGAVPGLLVGFDLLQSPEQVERSIFCSIAFFLVSTALFYLLGRAPELDPLFCSSYSLMLAWLVFVGFWVIVAAEDALHIFSGPEMGGFVVAAGMLLSAAFFRRTVRTEPWWE